MTSLAEAYDDVGRGNLRRLYLGTGLFVAGAVLVVLGIAFFSTGIGAAFGLGVYGAREVAGVAAGLGVPAVFVGVFTVLPASDRERVAAAIGAAISVFGVLLFAYAYPERWVAAGPGHLTLPVVIVYFLGAITAFWALFTAVVNFKTRNDPGGTVTLSRIVGGETRRVEVPVSELEGRDLSGLGGVGGVGVLGDVDREGVEDSGTDGGSVLPSSESASAASDGGTEGEVLRDPGDDRVPGPDAPPSSGPEASSTPDRYCGSCAHFDYVNDDGAIRPYCGHDDRVMDDMDPCEHWAPNR